MNLQNNKDKIKNHNTLSQSQKALFGWTTLKLYFKSDINAQTVEITTTKIKYIYI